MLHVARIDGKKYPWICGWKARVSRWFGKVSSTCDDVKIGFEVVVYGDTDWSEHEQQKLRQQQQQQQQ
jgi:hypothetical protein